MAGIEEARSGTPRCDNLAANIPPGADETTEVTEITDILSQGDHLRLTDSDRKTTDKILSVSSIAYSLSDMSLSSSSTVRSIHEKDFSVELETKAKTLPVDLQFLPPTRGRFESGQPFMSSWPKTEYSRVIEPSSSFSFNSTTPELSLDVTSSPMTMTNSFIQEFDFIRMKEKLEAQKEFLFESFEKQSVLPQTLSFRSYLSDSKTKKCGSLKLKGRLCKFGRAAHHFLNTKILRQQPSVQRCDIQLDGYDDRVERLILVVFRSHTVSDREVMHISLPTYFETDRMPVPRFLLPSKQGEMITVRIYGIGGQEEKNQLGHFRKILVSGVCTVQFDSRPLLYGRLQLQPHRPGHSLAGLSKPIQSGSTHVEITPSDSDSYAFSTAPAPVATDFTELCVLQTADPFWECLALATSSCDQPAAFQARLSPGRYHAVCCYRLNASSVKEVFSVFVATPTAHFKAYMDKTKTAEQMIQAVGWADPQDSYRKPALCPTLLLLRPQGMDVEGLMQMLSSGHSDRFTTTNTTNNTTKPSAKPSASVLEEGLHFCAWNVDMASTDGDNARVTALAKSWYPFSTGWTSMQNPRLLAGSREYTHLPSLSVFNMSTRLYFADSWNYYDKHYVILVVCAKGSPCHQVCKRHLQKLDPYNNPFLFRRRCFEPELSIAVYASASVNVEVIYSNSASVRQLISACSENVYFSKVRVVDATTTTN